MRLIRKKTLGDIIYDKLDDYDDRVGMISFGLSYFSYFIKSGRISLSMYHSLGGHTINKKSISNYNRRYYSIAKPLSDLSKFDDTNKLKNIIDDRIYLSEISRNYDYYDTYKSSMKENRRKRKRRLRKRMYDIRIK